MASGSPAGVLLVWDHVPPTDAGDEAPVWLVTPEEIVEAIRDAFHFASPRSPQGKRLDGREWYVDGGLLGPAIYRMVWGRWLLRIYY